MTFDILYNIMEKTKWVAGTNFGDHYVDASFPTNQVVARAGVVYALPEDYTMLDQLFDGEADTSLLPEATSQAVRLAITMIGEPLARCVAVIDNTVIPPELKQIPLEDGSLKLDTRLAKALDVDPDVSLEDLHV